LSEAIATIDDLLSRFNVHRDLAEARLMSWPYHQVSDLIERWRYSWLPKLISCTRFPSVR